DANGFLAEINVTPFVDVMLVLLIIFMVTAPMLTQGMDVDLPQTRAVKNLPQDKDHLVLSVDAAGNIMLDDYQVDMANLAQLLKTNVTDQNKELYLRADKAASYGLVVEVMGEARAAGIDTLGIVAEPKPQLVKQPGS
ncbi:MAG: ExbD/TolR family protein, partial [Proteobacteria bacterium]|nr:ExbD/TolR family protein [Pseudomonadota bacterium]MBU1610969.1 ExbD/TolR family protein [Pseudomonadota bacterium]